jgi:hypothetical protein
MKKLILPLLLLVAFGMLAAVESDPSAIVGYVKYDCVAGNNMIALPMEQGFTLASEVGDYAPASSVGAWNPSTELWEVINTFPWGGWDGEFNVTNGQPLLISVDAALSFYSIGDLPTTIPSYTLVAGNNTIMVPLNRSDLDLASEVGDAIPASSVGAWNATTELWEVINTFPWGGWDGEFATAIGDPLLVSVDASGVWPSAAKNVKIINSNTK